MKHSTRVRSALAHLPEVDPAIAALSLWCTFRDGERPTTTKDETVHVGPEFETLPISEQVGLVAHHVLHVALRHSARRRVARERYGPGFRENAYDLACDALVNEMLLQGGHALPRPAVRAAEIVALLPPEARPENVLADWDAEALYNVVVQTISEPNDTEEAVQNYAKAQGFEPDLDDGTSGDGREDIWSARVEQALSAGKRAGSGIGAVLVSFGDLPTPVVPWEIRLRRLLNKALSQQPRQSYRRPARMWLARDAFARQSGGAEPIFEPGATRDDRRTRLVVCLDTSSSIQSTTLDLFASEAASMVRRTGAEAHLLAFDTEVHTRRRIQSAAMLQGLTMRRDGGTDYEAVLTEASALDPSLVVVLTDLDAPTLSAPAASVLWAVPAPPPLLPRFGDVLVMDDSRRPERTLGGETPAQ